MTGQRSAEELERLRERFLIQAKAAFEQMFGQDGKNGLVTFTERAPRRCPRCRKFFSPGRSVEVGDGRVQLAAASED